MADAVIKAQLDELFALLSAVKAGEVSETEAVERLSRSPHWVWAAIDRVCLSKGGEPGDDITAR